MTSSPVDLDVTRSARVRAPRVPEGVGQRMRDAVPAVSERDFVQASIDPCPFLVPTRDTLETEHTLQEVDVLDTVRRRPRVAFGRRTQNRDLRGAPLEDVAGPVLTRPAGPQRRYRPRIRS